MQPSCIIRIGDLDTIATAAGFLGKENYQKAGTCPFVKKSHFLLFLNCHLSNCMFLEQKKFGFIFFYFFFLLDRSFFRFGAVSGEGIVLANYHSKGISIYQPQSRHLEEDIFKNELEVDTVKSDPMTFLTFIIS